MAVGSQPVRIERWPSERPLLLLVALAALAGWIALVVSIVGLAYAALLGLLFFFAHVAFVTHLRGNAVRLGPEQMPELWARVVALSERIGLREPPAAYVLQAGGTLNALATRFLRSDLIVLYSDLLDACGDNEAARDFIIAHELGHLHAGHLRWQWLLLPGFVVPFLGGAYSRAREYTCDRYGLAAASDPERALDGLCVLAAGGQRGPRVNRRALVAQREDLETIWMKLGQWLSTHPPIAHRLAALEPSLGGGWKGGLTPALGAAALVLALVTLPIAALAGFFVSAWPEIEEALEEQAAARDLVEGDDPAERVRPGIFALVEAAERHREEAGAPPNDRDHLYALWAQLHPEEEEPADPWSGARFGYRVEDGEYVIYSTGPDAESHADDLWYSSREAAAAPTH